MKQNQYKHTMINRDSKLSEIWLFLVIPYRNEFQSDEVNGFQKKKKKKGIKMWRSLQSDFLFLWQTCSVEAAEAPFSVEYFEQK